MLLEWYFWSSQYLRNILTTYYKVSLIVHVKHLFLYSKLVINTNIQY